MRMEIKPVIVHSDKAIFFMTPSIKDQNITHVVEVLNQLITLQIFIGYYRDFLGIPQEVHTISLGIN